MRAVRLGVAVAIFAITALIGASAAFGGTYTNPLQIAIPAGGSVASCADPSVIHGQTAGDGFWYAYCTTDALNDSDQTAGNFNFHLIPMLRSLDLVHWTYVGDAFATRPAWVSSSAGLWSPDIEYFNGQYYLYFTASDTSLPGGGSAIGVATSSSPTGPWVDSGSPVVEPHAAPCCPGSLRWVFDPDVVGTGSGRVIFYGSYFGGISARTLSSDGLHSDPATQVQITIANRYESSYVVHHGGYWYLFASATNCCNGPLSGYSTFVGRSTDILGPYTDQRGVSLLSGRVGGTPVVSMNGNRWVGPGGISVLTDFQGQDWALYDAVDRNDPYFDGAVGYTKRPLLLDPLDWINGWPTVRGGLWASDDSVQQPAAQPGQVGRYSPKTPKPDNLGKLNLRASDEFGSATLGQQWTWVREPAAGSFSLTGGAFRFDTQAADLYVDSNNASVLAEAAPPGNYVVETKVDLNLPPEGCCYNYVQAGLVVYADDDNYVKLADESIWETRQTEFSKELSPVASGYPRYGNTVVGPPADSTYLRIVHRAKDDVDLYTAYTSGDGVNWVRGGTWTASLGAAPRIGLVSMGGSGFTASFDYLRVYSLK
jgi:arabinan endo-1,5-alpha-L-arabinosidase